MLQVPMLPYELIAIIVELAYELHGTRTTETCTLVSSAWRSASRRTIFRRVRVTSEERLNELVILLSMDQTIPPLVRSLVFREDFCGPESTHGWVNELPRRLPEMLPNLVIIEFIGIRERFATEGSFAPSLSCFQAFNSVQSFVIRSCTVTPAILDSLTSHLPAVQALSILCINMPRYPSSPTQSSSLRGPSLRSLELDVGHIFSSALRHILSWVLSTPSRTTLRSLTLTLRTSDAEAAGRFLQEVGPQLEELELRFEEYLGLPLETESKHSCLC
ncbi:uncharacterized protein PHACADRAFT_149976 [Phanerochaete carnosa HHB-10118-sp]|uniref:F-box domain-containing protein n=1 Tax=Phanerochaete carnosa (strain HHB-10118-sp) TaxID=650164 RepID=K5VJK6_PHACS|nr:uncharacterized protein PHACADRAFT_149976 [Phanerochaete carnosa HHB-10118-sp]EKM51528.1 hypothetical protein PHACADRAFT_149976 [Phanerochaete carnosa HHB-10118-sp]